MGSWSFMLVVIRVYYTYLFVAVASECLLIFVLSVCSLKKKKNPDLFWWFIKQQQQQNKTTSGSLV